MAALHRDVIHDVINDVARGDAANARTNATISRAVAGRCELGGDL